ncbi:MAG: hypothetical protein GXO74_02500 [Calditrichaeota bacterium]|nr:hypothetical protein [Calditrichota bacterium]
MNRLLNRMKSTLLPPMTGWDELREDAISEKELIKNYLLFTAAIPAIAGFLGLIFSGENLFRSLLWAVLFYGFAIAGIYLLAKIMTHLASSFNAEENTQTYLKLAIFASAPIFASCIFFIIPPLYWLSIVGVYGFWQFWVGYEKIVLCPEEEKFNFFFISLVAFILITILIFLIPALIMNTAVYL